MNGSLHFISLQRRIALEMSKEIASVEKEGDSVSAPSEEAAKQPSKIKVSKKRVKQAACEK